MKGLSSLMISSYSDSCYPHPLTSVSSYRRGLPSGAHPVPVSSVRPCGTRCLRSPYVPVGVVTRSIVSESRVFSCLTPFYLRRNDSITLLISLVSTFSEPNLLHEVGDQSMTLLRPKLTTSPVLAPKPQSRRTKTSGV